MKFVKASRPKVPFREIVFGGVFYSEDFGNYGMRIAARDATSYSNAILFILIKFPKTFYNSFSLYTIFMVFI